MAGWGNGIEGFGVRLNGSIGEWKERERKSERVGNEYKGLVGGPFLCIKLFTNNNKEKREYKLLLLLHPFLPFPPHLFSSTHSPPYKSNQLNPTKSLFHFSTNSINFTNILGFHKPFINLNFMKSSSQSQWIDLDQSVSRVGPK